MIGLREFKTEYRNCSFRYKIKELYWQIKYAWQRAWRGYDDVEVFELSGRFTERMLPILKDFRKNNIGLFGNGKRWLSENETNQIIDAMIFHLENSDANGWVDLIEAYDDKYYEDIRTYEMLARLHEKEFLRLFCKWFDSLWY